MTPEQGLYRLLRPNLPGIADRVENVAGAGMPDFFCITQGAVYWLECKVARTRKWDLMKLLEPSQIAWASRYRAHGGEVFFIVRDAEALHLFNSPTNKIGVFPKPFDWEALKLEIHLQLMTNSD